MATPIIMPRQGQSVESCIIGEWHKKKGDRVNVGDVLFTYETDKATFDETAKTEGELLAVFFGVDDDVPCLLNVCVIGEAGESWSEFIPEGATQDGAGQAAAAETAEASEKSAAPAEAALTATTAAAAAVAASASAAPPTPEGLPTAVSPRARRTAEARHVDLRCASATGPDGRVIERDVLAALEAGHYATAAAGTDYAAGTAGSGIGGRVRTADLTGAGSAAETAAAMAAHPAAGLAAAGSEVEFEDVRLPNIRKVIARTMHDSLATMAQLTLHTTFDATDVLALRARLKAAKASGLDQKLGFKLLDKVPTLNDIVLFAVARTVLNFPACNAHFLDDKMRRFNRVHLGVAVDTPRGLMVPVLKNADRLSLSEISSGVKTLAAACQSGSVSPDDLKGSTISVSNIGAMGVESFTPVINPPETCILGVGALQPRVREVGGTLQAYQVMGLSLTIDHRALDGAPGARFLQALARNLENFSLLLMEG